MRTVDIDSYLNDDAFKFAERSYKAGKIIRMVRKGGKVNPALIWVEAFISVGEAAVAYMNYKKEEAINERLKEELKTAKLRTKQLKEEAELLKKEMKSHIEQREKVRELGEYFRAEAYESVQFVQKLLSRASVEDRHKPPYKLLHERYYKNLNVFLDRSNF